MIAAVAIGFRHRACRSRLGMGLHPCTFHVPMPAAADPVS